LVVSDPRPDGPNATPIRMNPMIGLIRNRAKTGMTIPAAPRITSASLKPEVENWSSIEAFVHVSGCWQQRRGYLLAVDLITLAP
jgi:hypothetical protein